MRVSERHRIRIRRSGENCRVAGNQSGHAEPCKIWFHFHEFIFGSSSDGQSFPTGKEMFPEFAISFPLPYFGSKLS